MIPKNIFIGLVSVVLYHEGSPLGVYSCTFRKVISTFVAVVVSSLAYFQRVVVFNFYSLFGTF